MDNEAMQAAFKDLQDSLVMMAHIKARQIRIRGEKNRARSETNLAEIAHKLKLNRLISGDRDLNDYKGNHEQ